MGKTILPLGAEFILMGCDEKRVYGVMIGKMILRGKNETIWSIGAGVTIETGANIIFKAPTIKIQSGFNAKNGSTVSIRQE